MSNGVSRREFVKYSLATGALLAAGDNILNNMMAQAARRGYRDGQVDALGLDRQLL